MLYYDQKFVTSRHGRSCHNILCLERWSLNSAVLEGNEVSIYEKSNLQSVYAYCEVEYFYAYITIIHV